MRDDLRWAELAVLKLAADINGETESDNWRDMGTDLGVLLIEAGLEEETDFDTC